MTFSSLQTFLAMLDIYFHQALNALRDNRLRTLLSISGVTIGIAAVMVVGSISKGGRNAIHSELETFGLASFWVYRDYEDNDPRRGVRSGTGIENDDYQAIRSGCCSAVKRISPIIVVISQLGQILIQAGNRYSNSQMQAVGADYPAINNDTAVRGRFFREEDVTHNRAVAIIGIETQRDLFREYENPIGKEIRLGGKKFLVIGVLKPKNRDFLASVGSPNGQNANKRVLIPFTTHQQMFANGNKDILTLQGEAVDVSSAEIAATQIKNLLDRRHTHRYTYRSNTMAESIASADRILQGVTIIGIMAASVSLFVGGMGIMNIMSASVVERTREIGIRKAIGASRKDVMFQFLFESMLISGIGGVLGLVFGALIGYLMAILTGLPLAASWGMAFLGLFVSIGVGLISGYYPAYRAASLKPVEALRHE